MRELLQHDPIAILGYGVEGRAMLDFLLKHGYTNLTICDQDADLRDFPSFVHLQLGSDYLRDLGRFDVVFRSPGISILKPELRAITGGDGVSGVGGVNGDVGGARGRDGARTQITSMMRYFFQHCPCPIIGVTGTKGKGTTSTLLTKMLEKRMDSGGMGVANSVDGGEEGGSRGAVARVFLGGNIGVPAISFLDELRSDDLVVLEMSSFQLADMQESPHVAIVLHVTSEHLDYHTDVHEYRDSKKPIVAYQKPSDLAVMNMDYSSYRRFFSVARCEVLGVSLRKKDHCGAWVDDGVLYVKLRPQDDAVRVARADEVALLGRHHLENVMPAVVVAMKYGVSLEAIREVLRTFAGLEHRLEPVGVKYGDGGGESGEGGVVGGGKCGVAFYNDSFATTPEACLAACRAFEDRGQAFVLIAGGSEKGSHFSLLGRALSQMRFLEHVYLMGPAGVRIGEAIRRGYDFCMQERMPSCTVVACDEVSGLAEAAERGFDVARRRAAKDGATCALVMSPAAASFNEFTNYKERGKRFKELFSAL